MSSYAVNPALRSDPIFGDVPMVWVGTDTPDGDRAPWSRAPQGSEYKKIVTANQTELYEKVKNDARNDDWVLRAGEIAQRVDITDFTDGGSTTGTLALTATIPEGAYALRSFLSNNTAQTGGASLTIQIGDGTDVDRYTTGTPSVASAATSLALGAPSGTLGHTAAKTPTVTLTEATDFGLVTAWAATVVIQYTGSAI